MTIPTKTLMDSLKNSTVNLTQDVIDNAANIKSKEEADAKRIWNYGFVGSTIGIGAGLFWAYKRGAGGWGYLGWALLGSMIVGGIGAGVAKMTTK